MNLTYDLELPPRAFSENSLRSSLRGFFRSDFLHLASQRCNLSNVPPGIDLLTRSKMAIGRRLLTFHRSGGRLLMQNMLTYNARLLQHFALLKRMEMLGKHQLISTTPGPPPFEEVTRKTYVRNVPNNSELTVVLVIRMCGPARAQLLRENRL